MARTLDGWHYALITSNGTVVFITCGVDVGAYNRFDLGPFLLRSHLFLGSYIAEGFEDFCNAVTARVCVRNCHFLLLCSFSCSCELHYLLMKNGPLGKSG